MKTYCFHQVMFPARVTQSGVPLLPYLRGPGWIILTGRDILRALRLLWPVRGGSLGTQGRVLPQGDRLFIFFSGAQNIWIRCQHGFWTDYSLVCTPAECDKLTETESLSVVYLSNSTDFDSQAELAVTCKEEDVTLKEILTCKEVVNSVLDKYIINSVFKDGWEGDMPICPDQRRPKQAVVNSGKSTPNDPDIIIRSNFDSDDQLDNGVSQPYHVFCDVILAILFVRNILN